LSFVTLTPEDVADGVAVLGRVLHDALESLAQVAP
jgi:hypothetical protein